jgi:hypothetical protein
MNWSSGRKVAGEEDLGPPVSSICLWTLRCDGARARLPVVGTVNSFPVRTSAMPTGRGNHQMMFNKEMREGAGAEPSDWVDVVLSVDRTTRSVRVPPDLARAISASSRASTSWANMSYSPPEGVRRLDTSGKEARDARIAHCSGSVDGHSRQVSSLNDRDRKLLCRIKFSEHFVVGSPLATLLLKPSPLLRDGLAFWLSLEFIVERSACDGATDRIEHGFKQIDNGSNLARPRRSTVLRVFINFVQLMNGVR